MSILLDEADAYERGMDDDLTSQTVRELAGTASEMRLVRWHVPGRQGWHVPELSCQGTASNRPRVCAASA